jgi:hypothetical protein
MLSPTLLELLRDWWRIVGIGLGRPPAPFNCRARRCVIGVKGPEALQAGRSPMSWQLSGSWLNQIEHCFGPITKKRICRGVLRCIDERQAAISESFEHRDINPKPFVRIASAANILKEVAPRATSGNTKMR